MIAIKKNHAKIIPENAIGNAHGNNKASRTGQRRRQLRLAPSAINSPASKDSGTVIKVISKVLPAARRASMSASKS